MKDTPRVDRPAVVEASSVEAPPATVPPLVEDGSGDGGHSGPGRVSGPAGEVRKVKAPVPEQSGRGSAGDPGGAPVRESDDDRAGDGAGDGGDAQGTAGPGVGADGRGSKAADLPVAKAEAPASEDPRPDAGPREVTRPPRVEKPATDEAGKRRPGSPTLDDAVRPDRAADTGPQASRTGTGPTDTVEAPDAGDEPVRRIDERPAGPGDGKDPATEPPSAVPPDSDGPAPQPGPTRPAAVPDMSSTAPSEPTGSGPVAATTGPGTDGGGVVRTVSAVRTEPAGTTRDPFAPPDGTTTGQAGPTELTASTTSAELTDALDRLAGQPPAGTGAGAGDTSPRRGADTRPERVSLDPEVRPDRGDHTVEGGAQQDPAGDSRTAAGSTAGGTAAGPTSGPSSDDVRSRAAQVTVAPRGSSSRVVDELSHEVDAGSPGAGAPPAGRTAGRGADSTLYVEPGTVGPRERSPHPDRVTFLRALETPSGQDHLGRVLGFGAEGVTTDEEWDRAVQGTACALRELVLCQDTAGPTEAEETFPTVDPTSDAAAPFPADMIEDFNRGQRANQQRMMATTGGLGGAEIGCVLVCDGDGRVSVLPTLAVGTLDRVEFDLDRMGPVPDGTTRCEFVHCHPYRLEGTSGPAVTAGLSELDLQLPTTVAGSVPGARCGITSVEVLTGTVCRQEPGRRPQVFPAVPGTPVTDRIHYGDRVHSTDERLVPLVGARRFAHSPDTVVAPRGTSDDVVGAMGSGWADPPPPVAQPRGVSGRLWHRWTTRDEARPAPGSSSTATAGLPSLAMELPVVSTASLAVNSVRAVDRIRQDLRRDADAEPRDLLFDPHRPTGLPLDERTRVDPARPAQNLRIGLEAVRLDPVEAVRHDDEVRRLLVDPARQIACGLTQTLAELCLKKVFGPLTPFSTPVRENLIKPAINEAFRPDEPGILVGGRTGRTIRPGAPVTPLIDPHGRRLSDLSTMVVTDPAGSPVRDRPRSELVDVHGAPLRTPTAVERLQGGIVDGIGRLADAAGRSPLLPDRVRDPAQRLAGAVTGSDVLGPDGRPLAPGARGPVLLFDAHNRPYRASGVRPGRVFVPDGPVRTDELRGYFADEHRQTLRALSDLGLATPDELTTAPPRSPLPTVEELRTAAPGRSAADEAVVRMFPDDVRLTPWTPTRPASSTTASRLRPAELPRTLQQMWGKSKYSLGVGGLRAAAEQAMNVVLDGVPGARILAQPCLVYVDYLVRGCAESGRVDPQRARQRAVDGMLPGAYSSWSFDPTLLTDPAEVGRRLAVYGGAGATYFLAGEAAARLQGARTSAAPAAPIGGAPESTALPASEPAPPELLVQQPRPQVEPLTGVQAQVPASLAADPVTQVPRGLGGSPVGVAPVPEPGVTVAGGLPVSPLAAGGTAFSPSAPLPVPGSVGRLPAAAESPLLPASSAPQWSPGAPTAADPGEEVLFPRRFDPSADGMRSVMTPRGAVDVPSGGGMTPRAHTVPVTLDVPGVTVPRGPSAGAVLGGVARGGAGLLTEALISGMYESEVRRPTTDERYLQAMREGRAERLPVGVDPTDTATLRERIAVTMFGSGVGGTVAGGPATGAVSALGSAPFAALDAINRTLPGAQTRAEQSAAVVDNAFLSLPRPVRDAVGSVSDAAVGLGDRVSGGRVSAWLDDAEARRQREQALVVTTRDRVEEHLLNQGREVDLAGAGPDMVARAYQWSGLAALDEVARALDAAGHGTPEIPSVLEMFPDHTPDGSGRGAAGEPSPALGGGGDRRQPGSGTMYVEHGGRSVPVEVVVLGPPGSASVAEGAGGGRPGSALAPAAAADDPFDEVLDGVGQDGELAALASVAAAVTGPPKDTGHPVCEPGDVSDCIEPGSWDPADPDSAGVLRRGSIVGPATVGEALPGGPGYDACVARGECGPLIVGPGPRNFGVDPGVASRQVSGYANRRGLPRAARAAGEAPPSGARAAGQSAGSVQRAGGSRFDRDEVVPNALRGVRDWFGNLIGR